MPVSLALLAGLTIQASALGLLAVKVRGAWFRHLGAIFILLALIYHGLGEGSVPSVPRVQQLSPIPDARPAGLVLPREQLRDPGPHNPYASTLGEPKKTTTDPGAAASDTVSSGLTGQVILLAMTMTAAAVVLRFGPKFLLPMLALQVAVTAGVGQRGEVIVTIIVLSPQQPA